MILFNVTAGLAVLCFFIGFAFLLKESLVSFPNILILVGESFMTALSISLIAGFFDYVYNGAKLFGLNEISLLLLAFLGSFTLLIFAVYLFIVGFKKKGLFRKFK